MTISIKSFLLKETLPNAALRVSTRRRQQPG
jgi:hypothetical protein